MADTVQIAIELVEKIIKTLEKSLPYIVSPSNKQAGLDAIDSAIEGINTVPIDGFKSLGSMMKIINSGGSPLLSTVMYQAFIVDVLEEMHRMIEKAKNTGKIPIDGLPTLQEVGGFMIRVATRITQRYKIRVTFEPEYEAKGIRAFMVLKELQPQVRFLSISPNLVDNSQANLDNGFELDILSQEPATALHSKVGSVLEVINVQIFTETRKSAVLVLDPPSTDNSFDEQVNNFLKS